jgi:hypothetical protein
MLENKCNVVYSLVNKIKLNLLIKNKIFAEVFFKKRDANVTFVPLVGDHKRGVGLKVI